MNRIRLGVYADMTTGKDCTVYALRRTFHRDQFKAVCAGCGWYWWSRDDEYVWTAARDHECGSES